MQRVATYLQTLNVSGCQQVCEDLCKLGQAQKVFSELQAFVVKNTEHTFSLLCQNLFGGGFQSAVDFVAEFWGKLCQTTLQLHTIFQVIEREILYQEKLARNTNIGVQTQTVWRMTINCLVHCLVQAKGERVLYKLNEEMANEIQKFR